MGQKTATLSSGLREKFQNMDNNKLTKLSICDSYRIEWVCREGHSWEFRKWGKIILSLESSVKTPLIAEAFKLQKEGEIIQKICHTDRIFLKKYKLKKC